MLSFFALLTVIGLLGATAQWFMYRSAFSFLQARATWLLYIAPIFIFVFVNTKVNLLPLPITRALAWASGYWFAFFYYSLFLLIIYGVFRLLLYFSLLPACYIGLVRVGLAAIVLVVAGGAWNAVHPVVREVNITTNKLVKTPQRVVFVSDLHLGGLFGRGYTKSLVERINAAQPDLVLIGGDIVDGSLETVDKEESYVELQNLQAVQGVYAVYGNHDVMRQTSAAEQALLHKVGLEFVKNGTVELPSGIVLTGLDDYSRSKMVLTEEGHDTQYKIFMEHQPRHIPEAAASGYDLYVAGHTHAGQFYPNRELTKRMYLLDYGTKKFQQMTAIVSNGYGLWGVPVRVGPPPEIVVINIKST